MVLNIILSDFQQYRTLLAKVIQFFVSPEKCENQRYDFLHTSIQAACQCPQQLCLCQAFLDGDRAGMVGWPQSHANFAVTSGQGTKLMGFLGLTTD